VVTVNFTLAWDNSWLSMTTNNWDAAWVFFKYKDAGQWMHLDLTGNNITLPTGFDYTLPSDKKGIFIHRSSTNIGTGNVTLSGCQIGILPQMGTFDVKAFALEMVYVPTSPFNVGDNSSTGTYTRGGDSEPYYVTGNGLAKGNTYYYELNTPDNTTTLNPNFPTGYFSYYIMKYELSNGGYRDFLNCLTLAQQTFRVDYPITSAVGTKPNASNSVIAIATPSTSGNPAVFGCDANNNNTMNEANDGEWTACGGIGIADLYTYLDWAALRPMTDLEFEKACRGPLTPIAGMYAWGTSTTIKTGTISLLNPNQSGEAISTLGNLNVNLDSANLSGIGRPLRNGVFASSVSSRSSSGASYYGVMELTGNLCELVVNAFNTYAVSYNGINGDGTLGLNGYNTNWPFFHSSVTVGTGSVSLSQAHYARGGSYFSSSLGGATLANGYGKVSYMVAPTTSAATLCPTAGTAYYYRQPFYGIRGVR
jgi:formylglycine-generating enzyme required for sulfatase activity